MLLPFTFPDWMPVWLQLALVVGSILVGLAFLAMPFSVFGIKSRLDAIEERLDELQGEIRALSLRLREPDRGPYDAPTITRTAPAPVQAEPAPLAQRPPVPPAARPATPPPAISGWETEVAARAVPRPTLRAAARVRAEPRLGK